MHYYSMSISELYTLPIYLFWELVKNVDRLRAEEDQRLLVLFSHAFGGDPNKYTMQLEQEKGVVAKAVETGEFFDEEGLCELRALFGG